VTRAERLLYGQEPKPGIYGFMETPNTTGFFKELKNDWEKKWPRLNLTEYSYDLLFFRYQHIPGLYPSQ
jgi:hypothetical protein